MSTERGSTPPEKQPNSSPAEEARDLVRRALKGALATLDRETGHPYASLVTLATDMAGQPVMLLSRLARHTQNLLADSRASVLVDGTSAAGDPLASGRVTVIGRLVKSDDAAASRRFLARHPEASGYAAFTDFAFYALDVAGAHYVGGFGRIVGLEAGKLVEDLSGAAGLVEAEPDIVGHMNADHADALALYATRLAGAPDGPWRMTGIDPRGCDLRCRDLTARVGFAHPVSDPSSARRELVGLAARARGTPAPG